MIVRMKELLLFSSARTVDETIQRLGQLGVVEIKEVSHSSNGTVEWRQELFESNDEGYQYS